MGGNITKINWGLFSILQNALTLTRGVLNGVPVENAEPILFGWSQIVKSPATHARMTRVCIIWAALCEKVPNVLSHCHSKRRTGARGGARPSFGTSAPGLLLVWHRLFRLIKFVFLVKSVSYQNMTQTQAIRDLFAWRCPFRPHLLYYTYDRSWQAILSIFLSHFRPFYVMSEERKRIVCPALVGGKENKFGKVNH